MMFLAPSALWWLLAAAPIVAIFLFRRRIVEVRIPALVFWEQMRRRDAFGRWGRRVRRWAGLALHLLILLLLIGALAEPINPAYRNEMLIVLDDSATLRTIEPDGRQRASHAARTLLEKIRQAPGGVQTTVFLAGTPPKILIDRETVLSNIQAAVGTHSLRDVNPDFEQALTLARRHRQEANTPIIVISDRILPDLTAQPDIEWLRIGTPQPNLAVADVARSADGRSFDVTLRHRGMSPRTANVALISNQQSLATKSLVLQESPTTIQLPAALNPGDTFEIRVEPADAFALDNVWFGVCPPPRDTNLRLVSTHNEYLIAALDQPGVTLDLVPPDQWNPTKTTDVTIIDNTTATPGRLIPGRYVIFGGFDPFGFCRRGEPQTDVTPLQWAVDHPLARDVDFLSWRIQRTAGLLPPASAETIVGAPDAPLVFRIRRPGSTNQAENSFAAVYVNFPLSASNVVFRAGFPVFLWNAIDDLLGRRPEDYLTAQPTGRPLVFPAITKTSFAAVLDPRDLETQAYFDGTRLVLPFPEFAGFYRMTDDKRTWTLAVNYCSDISPDAESAPTPDIAAARPAVSHWWRSLPPWGDLAILAGALVLLETLLFHRGILKIG